MQSNAIVEGQRAHATSKRQESKETKDISLRIVLYTCKRQYTRERSKVERLFALMINAK